MKIELKMNGKNFFDPVFKVFYNDERTDFALGICHIDDDDYDFINDDLIENFENFEIKSTSFIYSTKDNIYVFDLKENFKLIPIGLSFEHSIVLLDEHDKIIDKEYFNMNTTLSYENNN